MTEYRVRHDQKPPRDDVEKRILEAEDVWWRTFITHGMELAGTPPWRRPLSDFSQSPASKILVQNPDAFDEDRHRTHEHEHEHEHGHGTLRHRSRQKGRWCM